MEQRSRIAAAVLRRGGARSSVVGLLAAAALFVGYFLPWTAHSDAVEDGLGLELRVVERSVRKTDEAERRDLAERLRNGEALSGAAWAEILDEVEQRANLNARQQAAVRVASVGVHILPYLIASLLVLLLLLGLPPGKALKVGGGPVAGVLFVAQTKFLSTILVIWQLALSLLIFVVTHTLWASAKFLGDSESKVGNGLFLMMAGSGLSLLAGFFGYGAGRIRALVWAIVVNVALAGFVYWWTHRG